MRSMFGRTSLRELIRQQREESIQRAAERKRYDEERAAERKRYEEKREAAWTRYCEKREAEWKAYEEERARFEEERAAESQERIDDFRQFIHETLLRNEKVWQSVMAELERGRQRLDDMGEQIRANTKAVLSVLDERNGPGGAAA